jgi:DeoR/GlpR family transcriptional regulator of sugar metabolism
MNRKTQLRQESILSRLRATQREWRVEELAVVLQVGPLTIRRDLTALEASGAILRTHGGCIQAGRAVLETAYHQRVAHNFELKRAIGREAARTIMPGATLLINDGSTTFHLAAHLGDRAPLNVYTNSIAMIGELCRFPRIALYILGGRYQEDGHFLGGQLTERVLENLEFDLVFLGADAINPSGQCLTLDAEVARTTQIMLRRGRRKVLLADHTKIGAPGNAAYGSLTDFDLWITTSGRGGEIRKQFRKMTTIKEVKR